MASPQEALEELKKEALRRLEGLVALPQVRVSAGSCGLARGAKEVVQAFREGISRHGIVAEVVEVGCNGFCSGAVMVDIAKPGHPGVTYANVTPELAERLVRDTLIGTNLHPELALGTWGEGRIEGIPPLSEHPFFKPQLRLATANCGQIDPHKISHYLARGGFQGLARALQMKPADIVEEMKKSGLRGRGGAAFPTGIKWEGAMKMPGPEKYVLCNAHEGDPGAFMDMTILEGDPFKVLEGMVIAGYTMQASEGIVYVSEHYALAIELLEGAIAQMEEKHLLGRDILGSGFSFHISVREGAGAYVCGEESGLMNSIEGVRGWPRYRPPLPFQRGLWGKPTNINNVKTYALATAVLSMGAEAFSKIGTEKSKGTAVLSLSGDINRRGVAEVPLGTPLKVVVEDIGGGVAQGKRLKAIQTGGPLGGCLPASAADIPVDFDAMAGAGSGLGSGGVIIFDERKCMVNMAREFMTFARNESCGKCTPCRVGTRHMYDILARICNGEGKPGDIDEMVRWGDTARLASLCGHGMAAANPFVAVLRYFRPEFDAHINEKRCPTGECRIKVPV